MLFENGLNINEICENYKKQLEILFQENIACAKFVKSKCANQPDKICTEKAQREAIQKSLIDQTQDINLIICGKLLSLLERKYLIEINGFSLVHSMIFKILQYFIHY